jgi:hypothetical protein
MHVVQHGRIFTRSPALRNPYTILLSMYYSSLLIVAEKSGNDAYRRSFSSPAWKAGADLPVLCKLMDRLEM